MGSIETNVTGGLGVSEIRRATQSPLNPVRWCCDLSCGHEQWVTSKRRPKRNLQCEDCVRDQREAIDAKKPTTQILCRTTVGLLLALLLIPTVALAQNCVGREGGVSTAASSTHIL